MTHTPETRATRGGATAIPMSDGLLELVVTPEGAGGATYDGLALTRFTRDRARDEGGLWLYLRDMESGAAWSATLLPMHGAPDAYRVRASDALVEIVRRDGDVEVTTEICAAGGNAELRRYTITNHGSATRRHELTT
ncbi:MAG TPA: hypothetical protein VFX39_10615, partial [Gemmatimonadaceae bacterium]|nr:hypothetical protein [Gemmatimonadaceae bacterium]